jgi:hypothetical protein
MKNVKFPGYDQFIARTFNGPCLNHVARRRSGTDRTVTPDEYVSMTTDLGMMAELTSIEYHERGFSGEWTAADITLTYGPVVTPLIGSSTDILIREAQLPLAVQTTIPRMTRYITAYHSPGQHFREEQAESLPESQTESDRPGPSAAQDQGHPSPRKRIKKSPKTATHGMEQDPQRMSSSLRLRSDRQDLQQAPADQAFDAYQGLRWPYARRARSPFLPTQ